MPTAISAARGGQKSHVEKFQELLRELFQFDCADLDFGIYRIMNHKRDVVERFIVDELPKTIHDELNTGLLERQALVKASLEKAHEKVVKVLGRDAIDPVGEIASSALAATPVAQEYLGWKERAGASRSRAAVEADVYNHLTAFFSRYYEDGDFVSKRRYSRKQRYAIPYNGEEVHLHWANADQYYVKTAEHFHNYDWKAPNGVSVRFRVREANVEQDNVKGERRFFLPNVKAAEWDEATRTVTLPFTYRPLNGQEKRRYPGKNQQEKIIKAAVASLPVSLGAEPLAGLFRERRRNAKDEAVTYLEHHLRRYTRRNDSDFFIHKDLHAFLARELDFYLKNEVLNLDELAAAGELVGEGWFQIMGLIRSVGGQIIDFLAQIEGFQKMLWEKRKFVTETNWCVAMRCVPPEFHDEIAANEAQWAEWRALGMVGEERETLFDACETRHERMAFLRAHPTLMLDTVHFSGGFADRLLGLFDDLDGVTDGVLLHSENWQALKLLETRYRGILSCIYIDPPYNAQSSEILYRNNYKHSSWLALMADRIDAARPFLSPEGTFVVAIDEVEQERLGQLLSNRLPGLAKNCVVVAHNPSGQQGDNFSYTHEYAYFLHPVPGRYIAEQVREDESQWDERNFRDVTGNESLRSSAKNCFYPILVRDGEVDGFGEVCPDDYHPSVNERLDDGRTAVYPVDPQGVERKWRFARGTVEGIQHELRAHVVKGRGIVDIKRVKKTFNYKSNWTHSRYSANNHGTQLLNNLIPNAAASYPKSIFTVRDCLHAGLNGNSEGAVADYFAGSGTTGHAVMNLNREDGGRRVFLLVEIGECFDTVLLPRVKKVAFAPEWKCGERVRDATVEEAGRSPRLIKYMRLESYEDALDGIGFDGGAGQLKLEEKLEGYLLNYMLKWETKDSRTLLNPAELASPFSYRLRVRDDGEVRERSADVAETFNYLLGLRVQTRRVYADGQRRYLVFRGERRDARGRVTVVIWRDTEGWSEDELAADRDFVIAEGMAEDAETVYVNGMSSIAGARPIEPLFKARMFAGVSDI